MSDANLLNESDYHEDPAEYLVFTNYTGPFYFDLNLRQSDFRFDLCDYLPASVNQDIGGIGVRHILNMKLSVADSRVGICILLDPNRHQSFGVLDGHLVEMGSILFESQCPYPVAKTQ